MLHGIVTVRWQLTLLAICHIHVDCIISAITSLGKLDVFFFQVVDIVLRKDDRGNRVPQYLIHFNGWNRRWGIWLTLEFHDQ